MRQALDSLGRLYTELASKAGEAIGVPDYGTILEPQLNSLLYSG
ncbi:hypothetical protein [Nostoc sp. FACHB-888]|nr:hypothetical protein [Nostoc sp. FACHB-888]